MSMKSIKYIAGAILSLFSLTAGAQTVDELISNAHDAYMNYDFTEASRLLAAAKKKARKEIPPAIEEEEKLISLAESFLDRVEKLVILDSISVPRKEFFKAYKLPVSSGVLSGLEGLPYEGSNVEYVFTNEGDDYKIWMEPDTAGIYKIKESIRLTDGKWHEPSDVSEVLNEMGNTIFPFMMADGVTLYFASDNDESLGGYDIFVAKRDATDGTFLQPQNIGMPYNSPYDDYMLAIDELNGVGWWATDRNQLGDDITIYLFKVNDLRSNYDPEEEGITDFAKIADYKATWVPDENYESLIEEINAIQPGEDKKQIDFLFPIPGGKTYTTLDDFKSAAGKTAMKRYLDAKKSYESGMTNLDSLRRKFAESKSGSLAKSIIASEKALDIEKENLRKLRSDVYKQLNK